MSQPVTMPALSDTMSNGRLVKWIKKPSDAVQKGDVIAEVETDQAVIHVHDALNAGATHAEILDALGVAVLMGGGPAAMYACDALTALEQFESARK
jgi:Biotin-requiring enzyme/Carboxymuconolactone decarboxylase family